MAQTMAGLAGTGESRQARDNLGLLNDFVVPRTNAEQKVAAIWCEVFNLDRVGADDDFFDLGGDSIIATTIAAAVSDELGIDLKPGMLMEYATVRRMASLEAAPPVVLPSNLVATRSAGTRPPLFIVHGREGITFPRPGFVAGFHPDQPIYAFQVRGFDGNDEPLDSVEDIAADYLAAMLKVQPSGPWFIAAFCSGSWIAVEMARQMRARDMTPDRVILLDPALLNATLRDEFVIGRGRISGGNIPLVSSLTASIRLALRRFSRRAEFFLKSGLWVTTQEEKFVKLPFVRDYYIGLQQRRLTSSVHARDDAQTDHIYRSDSAARASAILQLAFRVYSPQPLDIPVDMIVSQALSNRLANPAYPTNRALPNRRVRVTAETHDQTIAAGTPTNARLIQSMLDEAMASMEDTRAA